MTIPKEWIKQVVEKLNIDGIPSFKGNMWETTFCQQCGIDFKDKVYGVYCLKCDRDKKLEKICE